MTGRRLSSLLGRRVSRHPLLRAVRRAALDLDAELWLVGGFVRETALARSGLGDIDLICGRGIARLLDALRAEWSTRGFRFRKRGVTTWRFDTPDGRLDLVDASRRGLRKDLERRDFTVNAIAYDLPGAGLVDPLGGLRDLRTGLLRLPRPTVIREDPLRALRGARFLAGLPGFRMHRDALPALRAAARGVRIVSGERLGEELHKLLAAEAPHRGLGALSDWGLVDAVLPELRGLRDCVAGEDRPDVWSHTVEAIRIGACRRRLPGAAALRVPENRATLGWSLLLHDVAKPATLAFREDGRPTFHGHETLGAKLADAVLQRMKRPRSLRRQVGSLIRLHLRPSLLAEAGSPPRGLRRLVRDAGDDLELLTVHSACDALASGSPDSATRWPRLRRLLEELRVLGESRRRRPLPRLLDGAEVMRRAGIPEGPRVGELLAELREAQEEGTVTTRRAALRWLQAQASRPRSERTS